MSITRIMKKEKRVRLRIMFRRLLFVCQLVLVIQSISCASGEEWIDDYMRRNSTSL